MSMALHSTFFQPALDTPTDVTYGILYVDAARTVRRTDGEIARLYLEHVHAHCTWLQANQAPDDESDPFLLHRWEKDSLEEVMARRPDMEWGVI